MVGSLPLGYVCPNSQAIAIPSLDTDTIQFKDRVIANGGTISDITLAAVDKFITRCKTDGIWQYLYDVGLYCGDNLAAALTKLISPSGVQNTLTNFNFNSGDYSEPMGLKGDGQSKYLKTGFVPGSHLSDSSDCHISVYTRTKPKTSLNNPCFAGVLAGTSKFSIERFNTFNEIRSYLGKTSEGYAAISSPNQIGLITANKNYRVAEIYLNERFFGANSATVTNARPTLDINIFSLNSNGTAANFNDYQICFHSFGYSLFSSYTPLLYAAVQEFQQALGRAV